uniref:CCHC-type domain-containing protein n=1 Tax=Davidia involucrata TaxID=16924 RepID=A0A5B7BZ55_DAVIN
MELHFLKRMHLHLIDRDMDVGVDVDVDVDIATDVVMVMVGIIIHIMVVISRIPQILSRKMCNNIEANQAKGKNKLPPDSRDICYRCGVKGHWLRTCRTPKHLVELYQASIKTKGKEK